MLSIRDAYTKACYESEYLHEISDEEKSKLQAHLKKMYLDLQCVCDNNNLKLVSAYGTVLGAIRHHGFIPWDDDMDVFMTREDFESLKKVYTVEMPPKYQIYGPNTPNGARNCFFQLIDTSTRLIGISSTDSPRCGIYIDIFILENCPKNTFHWRMRQFVANVLRLIAKCVFDVENDNESMRKLLCSNEAGKRAYLIRRTIGKCFSFRSANEWANAFDRYISYKKKTGYYSVTNGGPYYKNNSPLDEELFFPVKKAKFEDIEINVPNNPERHCEIEYGDWTWIPPEGKRDIHFIREIKYNV